MKKLSMGDLKRKLKKLNKPLLEREVKNIILQDREIVRRKKDELKTGSRPDGTDIGTYRSEKYRLFKLQMNPLAGGKVDLILTGSTKDKLYLVSIENGQFTFESADPKWQGLVEKYGTEIKAINAEVFKSLQKTKYAPELVEQMKNITGL